MRFIHLSDVHLGASPEKHHPWGKRREEEIWKTFSRVIDACKEKKIDLLLISGDLFDRPPAWGDMEKVSGYFSRIPGTQVAMIAGSADHICEGAPWTAYPWPANVSLLAGKTIKSLLLPTIGTIVTGMSYYREEDSLRYPDRFPAPDGDEYRILLAYSGDEHHTPCDIEALSREGFDYIALGGFHKPKLMSEYRAAYAGSPEPVDRRETGKHGFVLGELTKAGTSLVFVPFALTEYTSLKVRITPKTTREELEKGLAAVISNAKKREMFTIRLEGKHRPGLEPDTSRLYGLGRVAWVQDDSVPDYNLVKIMDNHREDVIGMFLDEFVHENPARVRQKAMYCGLEALMNSTGENERQS